MHDVKVHDSRSLYSGNVISLRVDDIELSGGTRVSREVVEHPGAVVILPITHTAQIIFVKQYRHPIGKVLLELPAGTLEAGEEPLGCAQREIREEIGFAAKQWRPLGSVYPAPGFCNELQHLYLAQDLYEDRLSMDEDERIEVVMVDIAEVKKMLTQHLLQDAKTLAALLYAHAADVF